LSNLHRIPIGRDIMQSAGDDIMRLAAEITQAANAAPDLGVAVASEPAHPCDG
jgi:hypothetical protein